jgi:hypothetical protein
MSVSTQRIWYTRSHWLSFRYFRGIPPLQCRTLQPFITGTVNSKPESIGQYGFIYFIFLKTPRQRQHDRLCCRLASVSLCGVCGPSVPPRRRPCTRQHLPLAPPSQSTSNTCNVSKCPYVSPLRHNSCECDCNRVPCRRLDHSKPSCSNLFIRSGFISLFPVFACM